MGKKIMGIGLLVGLLCLLSGCLSQAGEGLYALPQMPQDYLSLQTTVDKVMSDLDAEYASPYSGSNTQNVQMQDLDGDGIRESAVAFFRVPSAEKPLKIYIFRQNKSTDEYEPAWILEGEGTGIYSASFEDLGGTEEKEVVVRWQISANAQTMTAYALQLDGSAVEMMRSGYSRSAVTDMDGDGDREIVLVQLDTAENLCSAELYNYDNGLLVLKSTVPLSTGITSIHTARVGTLKDETPALFISSDFGERGGRVTDVVTLREGVLWNLTLQERTGMSSSTIRYTTDFRDVNGYDITGDGILELPMPEYMTAVGDSAGALYLLNWMQYDSDGSISRVATTFHCYDDGWYLFIPEEWQGEITAARRDSVGSTAGTERAVSFYHVIPAEQEGEPSRLEEFLTIYRLTGNNRGYRASMDERVVIYELSDVIYAAKFRETEWDSEMSIERLRELFYRIRVEWSAES